MSTFEQVLYKLPISSDFIPILKAGATTLKTIAGSKDVLAKALTVSGPILKLLDKPIVEVGTPIRDLIKAVIADYDDVQFGVLEFFPTAPYNVLTYDQFLQAAEESFSSFGDFDVEITSSTRIMLWVVSSPDQEEFDTSVAALVSFLGKPAIKLPPEKVVRKRSGDFVKRLKTENANKLSDTIKGLTRAMKNVSGVIRDASDFTIMIDTMIKTLEAKSKILNDLAADLEAAIVAIDALEVIKFRRVIVTGVVDKDHVIDKFREVTDAPGLVDLAAGVFFVYDSDVATFVEGLLG